MFELVAITGAVGAAGVVVNVVVPWLGTARRRSSRRTNRPSG